MPPRHVVFGGLRIDYLISAEGEVTLGQCGGNALYAAAGAALWSDAVGVVSRAGTNYPFGWLAAFEAAGVDTSGVQRLPFDAEMRTFFAHAPGGDRVEGDPAAHFARLGRPVPNDLQTYHQPTADEADAAYAALRIQPDDVPPAFRRADGYHLAPMSYASQLALVEALREWGAPLITADPGEAWMTPQRRDDVAQILRHIDVFLPSEMEVATLLGAMPVTDAARWFADHGPRVVVIKRGAAGSLIYETATRRFTPVPIYPAQVRDVTGAGDAFCGAFLVGYARTGDALAAARRGAVAASLVVEGIGAPYALSVPPYEATTRLRWMDAGE